MVSSLGSRAFSTVSQGYSRHRAGATQEANRRPEILKLAGDLIATLTVTVQVAGEPEAAVGEGSENVDGRAVVLGGGAEVGAQREEVLGAGTAQHLDVVLMPHTQIDPVCPIP